MSYREQVGIGFLAFEFHNGAMSTNQCRRLAAALRWVRGRPVRVRVLLGGAEFWSNGIHLGSIEAASHPADESVRNIDAIDDVCLEIMSFRDTYVVAALRGNAAAGGAFMALAADEVWARQGIVLNPHYKNMGNRLPIGAGAAASLCLVDAVLDGDGDGFLAAVTERAGALAASCKVAALLAERNARRERDEARKPLAQYRAEELERMRLNSYGFDPSYHIARHRLVHRTPHSWTPRHLAVHRDR